MAAISSVAVLNSGATGVVLPSPAIPPPGFPAARVALAPVAGLASLTAQGAIAELAGATANAVLLTGAQNVNGLKTFQDGIVVNAPMLSNAIKIPVNTRLSLGNDSRYLYDSNDGWWRFAGVSVQFLNNLATGADRYVTCGQVIATSTAAAPQFQSQTTYTPMWFSSGMANPAASASNPAYLFRPSAALDAGDALMSWRTSTDAELLKLWVGGELEQITSGAGLILASPDGTRYRLTVANGGTLSIAAA